MDEYIRAAAGNLQQSAYRMQARIHEISSQEEREKYDMGSEENRLSRELREAELALAGVLASPNSGGNTTVRFELLTRIVDLRKRRDQLKEQTNRNIAAEEAEARSLQSQADQLQQIAHTLEMWP